MIGVLGLGGGGGNIADEAAKHGFHTAVINFSQRDLDSLENVKAKLKLIGSEGVGHNRDEAIRLLSEHHDVAFNFIKEQFGHSTVEVIIFAFATGGGSGAGISPILLDICSSLMPEKVFVAIPIIPELSETVVSQFNCIKTFEELSKLDMCILPIDNQKVRAQHQQVGKNKIFEISNQSVVELLASLTEYTQKYSKNGVFDQKDFKTILSTRGIGLIAQSEVAKMTNGVVDVSKNGLTKTIQKSWNDSVFAPMEFEKVTRAAIILDAPNEIMQFMDHQEIFNPFKHGTPIDLFEGNYHDDKIGKVTTVLTGLNWCHGRMQEIEKLIQKEQEKIEAINSVDGYDSTIGNIDPIIPPSASKQKPVKSVSDILSKYRK